LAAPQRAAAVVSIASTVVVVFVDAGHCVIIVELIALVEATEVAVVVHGDVVVVVFVVVSAIQASRCARDTNSHGRDDGRSRAKTAAATPAGRGPRRGVGPAAPVGVAMRARWQKRAAAAGRGRRAGRPRAARRGAGAELTHEAVGHGRRRAGAGNEEMVLLRRRA
jgi:hypothetical protein